ncbi:MAG: Crp/Fnr family transcriptional regulator [Alphaproteobacteria bacterium]|nr:MAG: Crp/Fnr family transcriptional regulator [Alphaproteobacteria bacterium]
MTVDEVVSRSDLSISSAHEENLRAGPQASRLGVLRRSFQREVHLDAGHVLAERGEAIEKANLVIDGFLLHTLHDGPKRAIVGVSLPGDIVGLSAFGIGSMGHSVVTAGPASVRQLEFPLFEELSARMPSIVLQMASLEAAVQRQWIANCQRLTAPQHIAHLFCEWRHRLARSNGMKQVVRTPFSQTDLGDMCGISAIHANRAVANLRNAGLAEIRRGDLYTSDWTELEKCARFDPSYLRAVRT